MARRGRGDGSVRQRQGGRWEARLSQAGQRLSAYGRTRREAMAKLVEARAAVEKGLSAPSDRITVARYLAEWLDRVRPSLHPATYDGYSRHIRLHLVPALGRLPVSRLSPADVETMLSALTGSGLSAQTACHIRATLRRALHDGERIGLVGRNAAALAMPPRVRRREVQPLTMEQTRTFLAAVEGDRLWAFYLTAFASGLRSGELRALAWSDCDLTAGSVTVRRTVHRREGAWVFDDAKTVKSHRTVPIPPIAVQALLAWRTRQKEERIAAGSEWRGHEWPGLTFTTELGAPIDASVAVRRFQAALAAAGLPRQRLHDTRHGAASIWFANGVTLRTVSELLGHSGIAITADIYAHLAEETKRDAADRMGLALAAR